jgi:uncharacterized protein YndB with AHSA1/START domain
MAATARATSQVYKVYIKATPQAIWDALTRSEWTKRYGYGGTVQFDLRTGGKYKAMSETGMDGTGGPLDMTDGEVREAQMPKKLVQTWRLLADPQIAAEGFTRLTYTLEQGEIPGVTKLTVAHDLQKAPRLAAMVAGEIPQAGGGWSYILSDLKTLLETGKSLREGA